MTSPSIEIYCICISLTNRGEHCQLSLNFSKKFIWHFVAWKSNYVVLIYWKNCWSQSKKGQIVSLIRIMKTPIAVRLKDRKVPKFTTKLRDKDLHCGFISSNDNVHTWCKCSKDKGTPQRRIMFPVRILIIWKDGVVLEDWL